MQAGHGGSREVLPAHVLVEHVAKAAAAAAALRATWKLRARRELERREAMENGRDVMRVILRAWREVADGIPAGAARWEQDWTASSAGGNSSARTTAVGADVGAGGGRCALARRLVFGAGASAVHEAGGWSVRVMLAWQRLVRAGKVHHARMRRGSAWREGEKARVAARLLGMPTRAAVAAAGLACSMQTYEWAAEEAIAAAQHTSSGAACVIARRGARAAGANKRKAAPTADAARTTTSVHAARARAHDADDAAIEPRRKAARTRRQGGRPSRALALHGALVDDPSLEPSSEPKFSEPALSFFGENTENPTSPDLVSERALLFRAPRRDATLILTDRTYGKYLRDTASAANFTRTGIG